ncbi:MAG: hypothetical protein ACRD2C_03555 [Acidimicrobiales bacterium]
MLRPLLIIAAGLFVIWVGLRSVGGYEAEAEHLYGGEFQTLTCEDGRPTDGLGMHTLSAERACGAERDQQRSRAPWWVALGLGVTLFGMSRFRKARAG